MAYDYKKTHELILKSAQKRFCEEGFRNASIRQICSDAGVTNGAFYAHFNSKKALLDTLAEPVIRELFALYGKENEQYTEIHSAEDILQAFARSFSSDRVIVSFIYAHEDIFRMIMKAGAGSGYEDLTGMFTEQEKQETETFFAMCRPYVKKPENLSESFVERVSTLAVSAVLDDFLAGKSEEDTLRDVQLVSEFCLAGLREIWGI